MLKMKDNKKISYNNTVIFVIVNAILSLTILIMSLFNFFPSNWIYFIIVLEVGIICIIIYCMYRIIRYEKLLAEMRNPARFYIPIDDCPDYFVRKTNKKNETICSNEYRVKDRNNVEYIMKLYPVKYSGTFPEKHSNEIPEDFSKELAYDKFNLQKVVEAPVLANQTAKCNFLTNEKASDYAKTPWTYVQSRCEGFY